MFANGRHADRVSGVPFLLVVSIRGCKSTNFQLLKTDCLGLLCQTVLEYTGISPDHERRWKASLEVMPTKFHFCHLTQTNSLIRTGSIGRHLMAMFKFLFFFQKFSHVIQQLFASSILRQSLRERKGRVKLHDISQISMSGEIVLSVPLSTHIFQKE